MKVHQAAHRRKKGARGGWPITHDAELCNEAEGRRTSDQQAENLAKHRHRYYRSVLRACCARLV